MAKLTVIVETLARTDDKVMVLNYRLRPERWEPGTVRSVKCGISRNGTYHVQYDVILDRRTTGRSRMFPEGGGPMFLTVGDDGIQ